MLAQNETQPAVSVRLVAYNQGAFIAEAIESVLAQRTNFVFELVIGEDFSTDATRKIVCDYRSRNPERIRLLLNEKNMGRAYNFRNTLSACQGRYIALLDGDDFWTASDKLQKQFDFLENHPTCAGCFHNAVRVYESGEARRLSIVQPVKPRLKLQDMLHNNIIPTCSVFFRNHLFGEFPEAFSAIPFSDWPLYLLITQHGDLAYMDDVMGAYRIHPGGLWSAGGQLSACQKAERHQWTIKFYESIDQYLDFKYHRIIKWKIVELRIARALLLGRLAPTYDLLYRGYKRLHRSRLA